MSRQIKDIKDKNTGQLVYPRTHISAVAVSSGTTLEDSLEISERVNNIIKSDGDGNSYLANDGTYKEVRTDFTSIEQQLKNTNAAIANLESSKQDRNLYFNNITASSWRSDSTYSDFKYKCNIACKGVTADMYAEVVFNVDQAVSGNYSPVCETGDGIVTIWSSVTDSITIPTIIITE